MKQPFVSVVIPTLNEEKYLPLCLRSLTAQLFKNFEVIISDGSSTDKTRQIAKKYGARVLKNPLRTIGFSRQAGLAAAKGTIVAFTDADTHVPVDWLSRIVETLSQPGVVGFFGGFRVPDGPWWYRLFTNAVQPILNTFYWKIFRFPMACGQNMAFYKHAGLSAGGFPQDFQLAEDIEMARRLMTIGRIYFSQRDYVISSGRRGYEGFAKLLSRISRAFVYYFLFRKADKVGFPPMR